MRFRRLMLPLLALPIALGGCGALGLGPPAGAPGSAAATPEPGGDWIVVAPGSATPSPAPSRLGSRAPVLPPVSFLPVRPGCAKSWIVNPPLIPIEVVPGARRLTVTWPRQQDSDYRITAVRQPLIAGAQPDYTWQNVAAGTGCTVTATITGLDPGVPYVVWLDAPNTGHELDGARHPYSGRSGVVYPR
ncbi:hypothetical protein GCM10020358_56690 [Amorphoplanes nipponensis]|uniref:Fibronectin type-III domain-containing protein n=1 Tax=Actinoplanes nipponensis TaxID=135950 RepID=A0A919JJR4_9ACTN|nr:hypothetical protein [Actinoplanes nipponensis]GIE51836.1 hypothetical protein Ani05nite_53700 [Actinoplanes nipponensis]